MQDWCNTGSCWYRKVVAVSGLVAAAAGRQSLVLESSCCCREAVAGAGMVATGAGMQLLVQEGGRWCRKVVRRTVSEDIRLDFRN